MAKFIMFQGLRTTSASTSVDSNLGSIQTPPRLLRQAPGVIAYWGVENIESEYERLLSLEAIEHKAVQDVGDGIRVGTVLDPFGNIVGLIRNPEFKIA